MLKIFISCILLKVFFVLGLLLPHNDESLIKQRYKRVIGGTPGEIENFPYLVSISIKLINNPKRSHLCGGSAISHTMILTAAHCTNHSQTIRDSFKVRVGSSYWAENGALYDVKEIIEHEDYDNITNINDISILILSKRLEFNEYVNLIPIAKESRSPGTLALVLGWGYTEEDAKQIPQNFNVVEVPIVDIQECRNIYRSSLFSYDGIICAGYVEGGKDACIFDSGGPLIEGGEIIGIVSLGSGCAQPNIPGVYTDVVQMFNWIIDKLLKNN